MAEPWLLQEGASIYAKISAINEIGESDHSPEGNGATLVLSYVPDAPFGLSRDQATTSTSQIGLLWQSPVSDNGQPIIDYRVWDDQGINDFVVCADEITNQPLVVTGLTKGSTYQFQVQARNAVGFSEKSVVYQIVTATEPDAPDMPTTTLTNNDVTIDWNQPAENGRTLLGYHVYIKQSNEVFSEACDGTAHDIFAQTACTVTVQTLMAAPFNLLAGQSVYAKVVAFNAIGSSIDSAVGNGAIIKLSQVPDAPVLTQDSAASTKTQIAVTWQDGAYNGGQSVTSYRLYSDQGSNDWKLVASNILIKSYTVVDLTPGVTYSIKIQSQNSIGYSAESNVVTALAAVVPAAPRAVSTYLEVNTVVVKWSAPTLLSEQVYGSAIQGYKVQLRWQDGTYGEQKTYCDGSDPTIIAETECIIPISTLMASPFNLQIGSSVYVSVLCYNEIGQSPDSDVGNGAIIQISTVPDAPLNLARSLSEPFDQTKLSLVWEDGLHDGNQVVLSYRVLIQNSVTFEWTTYADSIMTRAYTATGLVSGQSYTFAV